VDKLQLRSVRKRAAVVTSTEPAILAFSLSLLSSLDEAQRTWKSFWLFFSRLLRQPSRAILSWSSSSSARCSLVALWPCCPASHASDHALPHSQAEFPSLYDHFALSSVSPCHLHLDAYLTLPTLSTHACPCLSHAPVVHGCSQPVMRQKTSLGSTHIRSEPGLRSHTLSSLSVVPALYPYPPSHHHLYLYISTPLLGAHTIPTLRTAAV
jgi:hypothetical protein